MGSKERRAVDELNRLLQDGNYDEAIRLMRSDTRTAEKAVLYLRKDLRQRAEALLHREILRELENRQKE